MAALLGGLGTVDVDEETQITNDLPRRPQPRRVPRLSLPECVADLLTYVCSCDENCFDTLKLLPSAASTMQSARVTLVEAGQRRSSSLLFQMIKPHRIRIEHTRNRFRINFSVRGVPVCQCVWFWYHDLSQRDARVKRILTSIRRGDNNWVSVRAASGPGSGCKGAAGQAAQVWMREHVTNYSEQIPNRCLFRVEPLEIMELHERYIGEQQLLKALHMYIYIYVRTY
jgi:hypothetical protein